MTTKPSSPRALTVLVLAIATLAGLSMPMAASAAPAGPTPTAPCKLAGDGSVCSSTDPDLTVGIVNIGDTSGCTFTFTFSWDDGSEPTTVTFSGQSTSDTIWVASHTYTATQSQSFVIGVTAGTPTGGCTESGASFTFNLVAPATSTTVSTSLSSGSQSGTSITVPAGTAVTDTATLSGTNASTATGTVTYDVYSDAACTVAVSTGAAEPITTPGTLPSSSPVTLSTAGTYYWQASYSGDADNAPSTSACGTTGEVESVPAASTQGPTGPIVSGYRTTKCIDDSNDSSVNDTRVVMWDCNGSAGQNWTIAADGTIRINGKCMDIYRDEKANTAPVELWTCTGGANQQWHALGGTLVNPVSGKCLDDPRFNVTDGTQLEIYTCNGGRNQQWKLP
jgi:hypothetical protein